MVTLAAKPLKPAGDGYFAWDFAQRTFNRFAA
jgi:hypothetical protein